MENLNILTKKHIHFVGICGISMSGLAILTLSYGIKVTGSDCTYDKIVKKLRNAGIKVSFSHSAKNITDDCDLVVYTGAIKVDNVELVEARKRNIDTIERSEYLGKICKLYKRVIAIAGTHGKTTTTSMIAHIFSKARFNPTMHIGGIANNFDSNVVVGDKDIFITEACEYRNSFKYIQSDTCVVTSTEPDHMDCYKNVEELNQAYVNFAKHSKNIVVTDNVKIIDIKKNIVKVGLNKGNYIYAENLICNAKGLYSFDVWYGNMYLANFKLNVVGKFNVYNALCAIACALEYNISVACIYDALKSFTGVKRRNEKIGEVKGIPIICDYAHHPTEIEKTLEANKILYKKILCVFQPHTYSRTKTLMLQFVNAFKKADKLIIYKTYPAREDKIDGGDATDLFKQVNCKENKKFYASDRYLLKKLIYSNLENCNCILILGAGNIYNIAKNVFKSKLIC